MEPYCYNKLYTIGIVFLVILIVIWTCRYYYNGNGNGKQEGFSQSKPFVLKQNDFIYDDFYLQYYDELYSTDKYSSQDMKTIKQMTPINESSIFLDIGCGTGSFLKQVEQNGYIGFGVDKSPLMVSKAQSRLQSSEVECRDVLKDPMYYENNTFTHIVCTHFTIYEIEDKATFFKHCFHWLRGGGHLIIHLVDPELYKKTPPCVDLSTVESNAGLKKMRIVKPNYDYQVNYTKPPSASSSSSNTVIWRQIETFTDKHSTQIRKNEQTLYMEPKQHILSTAMDIGFLVKGESVYKKSIQDEHQFLVVLQKPMCGTE